MIPKEVDVTTSTSTELDVGIPEEFWNRSHSDTSQLQAAARQARHVKRPPNINTFDCPPSPDQAEPEAPSLREQRRPSRGAVSDLFRFRRKTVNPPTIILPDHYHAARHPGPDASPDADAGSTKPVIVHHRQRSKSTVDRPQIFLTDPAVNRPQVAPATVESFMAKLFRQKRDLAPQWVKASDLDLSGSSSLYDPGDSQSGSGSQPSRSLASSPDSSLAASRRGSIETSLLHPGGPENTAGPITYNNFGRRLSLLPSIWSRDVPVEFNNNNITSDATKPKPNSRGLTDIFRIRKKSTASATSYAPPEDGRKSPLRSPTKKTLGPILRRQRSKSTAEAPRNFDADSDDRRFQIRVSEPISVRVFDVERELQRCDLSSHSVPGLSSAGEAESTPMGELLARQASPTQQAQSSTLGIARFLELYKNHSNVYDNSRLKAKPLRRHSEFRPPIIVVSEVEPESEPTSPRIKVLPPDLPPSIPESMEVHQTSDSPGLLPRASSSSLRPPEDVFRDYQGERAGGDGLDQKYRRRYSEPPKPNLRQLAVLNSMKMKLVSTRGSDGGFQRVDENKNHINASKLAESFGLQMPMMSRHRLLLWRDSGEDARLLKLPVNSMGLGNQDVCNFESNDKLTYVKLAKFHKCHELMPQRDSLILFDSELQVISAFDALMFNGIRSAPIWNSSERDFVGMLTVTVFINVLQIYYNSPEEIGNLEEHKISKWIDLLRIPRKRMIKVDPDDSLFDAVFELKTNAIHRVLVADSINGNALYVLNYRRILQFIYLLMHEVEQPLYMDQSVYELKVGTYDDDVCKVTPSSRLIEALNLLVEKRISALPVVTDAGRVLNIYAKADVINLAADQSYKNLDTTIEEALQVPREKFEGVFLCKRTDSLRNVIQWLVQENVHRMLVVDDDLVLTGIVSLSDIVHFLVIQQHEEAPDYDVQPGDIGAELAASL